MSLRVDFLAPIDGASGRVDVMRVLASDAPIADDFNAAVVFSSAYAACMGERFSATISGLVPGTTATSNTKVTGSFPLTRKYKTYPMVLAAHTQDDGVILQPTLFSQVHHRDNGQGNGGVISTLERVDVFAVDVVSLGNNDYRVDYVFENFGIGSSLRNGVLRVFVFGEGI